MSTIMSTDPSAPSVVQQCGPLHLLMEAHVQGEKQKLCSRGLSILYHTAFEASKELWHAQKHIHVSLDHQLIVTVLHLVMGKGLKANRGIGVRVNREEG